MLWESNPPAGSTLSKLFCPSGVGCKQLCASCPTSRGCLSAYRKICPQEFEQEQTGLKIYHLEYTRHLIFQLEKCFTLALLMKIN